MKILLVIDQFDSENNGTTISTRRFAHYLREHGHSVKIVTTGQEGVDKYIVPERYVPIATAKARKQGMLFAKAIRSVLEQAISECDVVHFLMPFHLCKRGLKIAKRLGKAYTGAFHVQAENVTYNIGLADSKLAARAVYSIFHQRFYKHFTHIHCPSNFIANELRQNNYYATLHVISNGIDDNFVYNKSQKPSEMEDKFIITMVGRLSKEKRQDLLINAVAKSKYADKIQLIFAGKGPKADYYRDIGKSLINQPIFGFYTQEQLINTLSYTDLYVHTADIEIEAISALEALATGLVPVISNSPQSATKQFALDSRSIFDCGNVDSLVEKIEYWIDNSDERLAMERKYAEFAKDYNIHKCVYKMERMFQNAIDENLLNQLELGYDADDFVAPLEEGFTKTFNR